MANGNPYFEIEQLPALERFFAPLARVLEDFAARYGLRLVKYEKQNGSWDFVFRHPSGGVARIQVLRSGDESVLIAAHWAVHDYAAFRRKTFSMREGTFPRDDPRLASILARLLRQIVALSPDNLVPDEMTYERYWRADISDQVRAAEMALPLPSLDEGELPP